MVLIFDGLILFICSILVIFLLIFMLNCFGILVFIVGENFFCLFFGMLRLNSILCFLLLFLIRNDYVVILGRILNFGIVGWVKILVGMFGIWRVVLMMLICDIVLGGMLNLGGEGIVVVVYCVWGIVSCFGMWWFEVDEFEVFIV